MVLCRSKGEAKAMFLRHEGFLGALGALMSHKEYGFDKVKVPQQSTTHAFDSEGKIKGDLADTESIECRVYAA